MLLSLLAAIAGGAAGFLIRRTKNANQVSEVLDRFTAAFEICLAGRDDITTRNATRRLSELKDVVNGVKNP